MDWCSRMPSDRKFIEIQIANFNSEIKEESGFLPTFICLDDVLSFGETLGPKKEWEKYKHLYGYSVQLKGFSGNEAWYIDKESYDKLKQELKC